MRNSIYILIITFLISSIAFAQVQINTNGNYSNPSYLIDNALIGNGVITSNHSFTGDPSQIGFFSDSLGVIGMDSGFVLSTGGVDSIGVLYAHPAETGRGLEDIKNAVLGVLDLEMKVEGWRGPQMEIGSIDSSAWEEGGDAIDAAMRFLKHLKQGILIDTEVNLGKIIGGDRIGSVPKQDIRLNLK